MKRKQVDSRGGDAKGEMEDCEGERVKGREVEETQKVKQSVKEE